MNVLVRPYIINRWYGIKLKGRPESKHPALNPNLTLTLKPSNPRDLSRPQRLT